MRPDWPNGIVSGSPARASDIESLRDEINRVRSLVGLSPISWPPLTTIKASDFIQMRDAIQDIWDDDLDFGDLPPWTGGTPQANAVDPAVHVMDLRTWISRASDFPPEQGVDSFSYTPVNNDQTQWAVIGSGWRPNIQGFTSDAPDENKVRYVRCKVVAKRDGENMRVILSQDTESRNNFVDAFNLYKNHLRVFATINLETYRREDPYDASLGTVGNILNTSQYIEGFATELGQLHTYFGPAGVSDYIIWNEPNDTNPASQPKALSSSQFAALLRRCWQKVVLPLPPQSRPRIYWGGILFTHVTDSSGPQSGQIQYVGEVYSHVRSQLSADPPALRPPDDKLPWDGINLHLHHTPFEQLEDNISFMRSLMRDHIWPIQIENGDGGWTLIGEWGVTRQDLDDDPDSLLKAFQRIRPWSTTMFFFTHPDFDQSRVGDESDWWGLINRVVSGGAWVTDTQTPQGPKYSSALD